MDLEDLDILLLNLKNNLNDNSHTLLYLETGALADLSKPIVVSVPTPLIIGHVGAGKAGLVEAILARSEKDQPVVVHSAEEMKEIFNKSNPEEIAHRGIIIVRPDTPQFIINEILPIYDPGKSKKLKHSVPTSYIDGKKLPRTWGRKKK